MSQSVPLINGLAAERRQLLTKCAGAVAEDAYAYMQNDIDYQAQREKGEQSNSVAWQH